MGVHTSGHEQRLGDRGQPRPQEAPFSPQLDAELAAIILKLESLYKEGRRTFVIVTHGDPDADAMAGCVGMDRLIRGVLPSDVSTRWMHRGSLCSALRTACGRATENISALPRLLQTSSAGSVAIVVVDQPGLHGGTVLPEEMKCDPTLQDREADIILDHHGESRHLEGSVCEPGSGSTAALVYRLLQLAQDHERYRQARFSEVDDARLALLVNVGARTDAGQNVEGPLPEGVSPYLAWVDESTRGAFRPEEARNFDVLNSGHLSLLEAACKEALVYEGVQVNGVSARLLLTYAGVAESSHCIGACASKLFELERLNAPAESREVPLAVVVCGIIRDENSDGSHVVHAGERVQISIRTEPPVDAQYIAHAISSAGGGRVGAAAAQIEVPEKYDSVSDVFYVSRLLDLLEVKLTWPEQYSWNLDARS